MKAKRTRKNRGQAIVEYIIVVVIVAIAALAVMGIFSDTIKEKISGAVSELGGSNASKASEEASEGGSLKKLKGLQASGSDSGASD